MNHKWTRMDTKIIRVYSTRYGFVIRNSRLSSLASLKTYEKDFPTKASWKYELTKMLYERGYSQEEILNLYRFLDGISDRLLAETHFIISFLFSNIFFLCIWRFSSWSRASRRRYRTKERIPIAAAHTRAIEKKEVFFWGGGKMGFSAVESSTPVMTKCAQ